MRALAAMLFSACAALHPAAPTTAAPPPSGGASAAASDGATPAPAPAPTTDRPSRAPDPEGDSSDDPAADDDGDSPGSDFVDWDHAVALRGLTLAQAKQWLTSHGFHGELTVEESHAAGAARCAFDTVCDWEPREFHLDQPLTLTINKTKLVIAPPPKGSP
jgi:hypothetical protein